MNKNQPWDILHFTGSRTWNSKVHKTTTDVVDSGFRQGIPTVKFQLSAAHYISVGSAVVLGGVSQYYKGTYKALAGTATDLIYVPAKYIAEELTSTATFKLTLAPGHAFEFGGFRLKLSAVGGTAAEALTITVDAGHAATVYDYQLYREPSMETIQFLNWNIQDNPEPFEKDDELDFAWANVANVTYGLEIFHRRR